MGMMCSLLNRRSQRDIQVAVMRRAKLLGKCSVVPTSNAKTPGAGKVVNIEVEFRRGEYTRIVRRRTAEDVLRPRW